MHRYIRMLPSTKHSFLCLMFTLQNKSDLPLCLTTHHATFLTRAHDLFLITLNILVSNHILAPSWVPFTDMGLHVTCRFRTVYKAVVLQGEEKKKIHNSRLVLKCIWWGKKKQAFPFQCASKEQNRKHLVVSYVYKNLRGWVLVNSFPTGTWISKHTVFPINYTPLAQ